MIVRGVTPAVSDVGFRVASFARPATIAMVVLAGCGGEPTGPEGGNDPSPSPQPLVFSSDRDGDFDLYLMNVDGSEVVQLTNEPGNDRSPRWSPDGRRIAFASDRSGASGIYVLSADGTGQNRLNDGTLPAWSPDGQSLAFAGGGGITIMSLDGSGARQVASVANVDGLDWEPSGIRIAFGYPDPAFSGFEVRTEVVNGDGTGRETLLGLASRPRWSPDGSRVAVHQFSNSLQLDRIAVVPLGGNAIPIETQPEPTSPAWSPDGTRILFTKRTLTAGVANEEIYMAAATGIGLITQITLSTADDREPDWRR